MGWVGRKGGASSFILLTSIWSRIKDLEEIEKQSNNTSLFSALATFAKGHLSNSNRPKALPKASFWSLVHNAKYELSDSESVVGLEVGADYELDEETNLLFEVFAIETHQSWK